MRKIKFSLAILAIIGWHSVNSFSQGFIFSTDSAIKINEHTNDFDCSNYINFSFDNIRFLELFYKNQDLFPLSLVKEYDFIKNNNHFSWKLDLNNGFINGIDTLKIKDFGIDSVYLIQIGNISQQYASKGKDLYREKAIKIKPIKNKDGFLYYPLNHYLRYSSILIGVNPSKKIDWEQPFLFFKKDKKRYTFSFSNPFVSEFNYHLFNIAFLSIIGFICLFTLFQYSQNKEIYYLYYSIYLVITFFYFFKIMKYIDIEKYQMNNYFMNSEISLTLLLIISYALFIDYFFNLPVINNSASKIIRKWIFILLGLLLIDWIFIEEQSTIATNCEIGLKVFLIFPFIYIILKIYKLQNKLSKLVITGTVLLIFFATITGLLSVLDHFNKINPVGVIERMSYFQIGVLIEILFFSTALSYKSVFLEKERQESILNLKMSALQSQMNPHFIVNCVTSINKLIGTNKLSKAGEYLQLFSHLIRRILTYSNKKQIRLEEEIEICKNYISLESLRFDNGFDFKLNLVGSIDTGYFKVPPFIIQPFLENALHHGLTLKEGNKKLELKIEEDSDERITITIEDNGIGRARAAKNVKDKTRKSMGIINTTERLNALNLPPPKIIDKTDLDGNPTGTSVKLFFDDF